MNAFQLVRARDPLTSHMAAENWRVIPGFSRYSASDQGSVRRDVRIYRTAPGLCRVSIASNGYPRVAVTSDGGASKSMAVHQLVMLAFVGPRPHNMHVCHSDGNHLNAHLANLRYDTPRGNVHDAMRHGTQVKGEGVVQHKLTEPEVIQIVAALDAGSTYTSLASRHGVTKHCIFDIASGHSWKHITGGRDRRNGYKFASIGGHAAAASRRKAGLVRLLQHDDGADVTRGGFRCWVLV